MSVKVAIIGLDGACWNYIDPWLEEGKLPNLQRLIKEGARGVLRSTIPPVSSVAWPSIYTGVNPGKHGVFDWQWLSSRRETIVSASGEKVKAVAIWKLLNDSGKRVGIMNVPMTYPPEKVDGFFISGMDTPRSEKQFTWPAELFSGAEKKCGEYKVFPHGVEISRETIRKYIDIWKSYEDVRTCSAINLLKKYEIELFFIVFQITDIINHFTNNKNILLEAYRNADENLGRLLKTFNRDTTIFVISDHGTKRIESEFYLNVWLRKKDLLSFKNEKICLKGEDAHSSVRKLLKKIGISKFPVFEKIIRHIFVRMFTKSNKISFAFWKTLCELLPKQRFKFSNIDWEKTKVFITSKYGCLYLNTSEHKEKQQNMSNEEEELKRLLVLELKRIREPNTGKRVFQAVVKKEECFEGEFLELAPDIVAVPTDGRIMISNSFISSNNSLFGEPSSAMVGDHSMNGIIVVSGKHIKKGSLITDSNVYDIVPSVLYLMNIPLPEYLDGRILKECIEEDFQKSHKPKYIAKDYIHQRDTQKLSQQDEDEMRDRLRALGYIG